MLSDENKPPEKKNLNQKRKQSVSASKRKTKWSSSFLFDDIDWTDIFYRSFHISWESTSAEGSEEEEP